MINQTIYASLARAASLGDPIRVPLVLPGAGVLSELVVVQTGGNLNGFSVKLFNNAGVAPPNIPTPAVLNRPVAAKTTVQAVPANAPTTPAELYTVLPLPGDTSLTVASAAAVARWASDRGGLPYSNIHTTMPDRVDQLYLEITVTSPADNKTFAVRTVHQKATD